MKICVLMKQVPEKNTPLKIAEDHCSQEKNHVTWVSNESDNYALEEALLLKEANGGEVIACTLGDESAGQVLKDAMAKGADRCIFLSDSQFDSLDILSISKVFASALKNENFDLHEKNRIILPFGIRLCSGVIFFNPQSGASRGNYTGTGLHPQIPQWRGSQPQPAQGEIRSGKFLGYLVRPLQNGNGLTGNLISAF